MYRFLLTPRWLSSTALALVAVAVCLWLGSWQLGRFEDRVSAHHDTGVAVAAAADAHAAPLAGVLTDAAPEVSTTTVGRTVTVVGSFDPAHQLLVPDRVLDGRAGYYVLTPLRTADGRTVAVVRGWAPGAPEGRAPEAPAGEVTVTGRLQAGESSGSNGAVAGGLPAGQLGTISRAALVNALPADGWYDGWVAADSVPAGLTAVPTVQPQGGDGLSLRAFQNLGYTLEWFVFGGFVVFMWFRLVRREAEAEQDRALGLDPVLE
ncbi:SURF1 family protein [Kitasatospora sp. NPDC057223]|uniref:SURF1 family protein n=1 Tax=Kitasatospora sp. NPDC057223 TaxID=3346055 RepID=UPI00363E4957